MLRIEFMSGSEDGRQIEFKRDEIEHGITIGRKDTADIVISTDTMMSRVHARLFLDGEKLVLRDENSTNGSFLGRVRIDTPVELKAGDKFRVGRTWLEILEFEA